MLFRPVVMLVTAADYTKGRSGSERVGVKYPEKKV